MLGRIVTKNYTNYLDVTSGWLVRFLYITPDHEKEWKGYRKETIDDITLKNKVREQLELIKIRIQDLPDVVDYELSNEAEEFFTKWQRDTETEAMKSKDKNKLRVLGRMHNYAIKISMLLLLGDNTDQTIISKNYIEIVCRMIDNYFLINSCNLMEDICRDEKHNLQDKVIGVLKTYGRLSLRDIMRYTHQPKNDLFAAIDALDENGSLEIKKICEDGKKTVFYELNGTKSIKSKITNVPIVADVANVPDVPEIKGIIATNVTGDINIHQMTNDKSVYLCDSRDKSDKRDSCDSRDKKNTHKKESKNDDIEQSRLNNIHRDQIERKGKEWKDQNKKSINSSTLTEFCGWYYNQHKDNDPSEIAELAKRIYSIPDYPAPRKYISILGEELTLVYNDISDLVQATKEEQEKVTA